ncbi:selenoneine synthase SenA [Quisquiliibacterium transsilvanicum]|uniref:Ergothioneine biosynthesis protein EgtB n=1 Tax=Quisquiliibacterium transsilvanicum TaxID=1549638 RepID=A0A7W8M869_9BURK|nr:selenoneine synthase SenA [Quisquiliibacterium transsilvanicum]MBB5271706.1 ergothioneine biosynthesis protein EgtB [Quisquiliibacterium transsilvanicum]
MSETSMAAVGEAARTARSGHAAALAQALQESRRDTLASFAACERAIAGLVVPQREELNPPLWELGHIGWFQEFWLARNPQRGLGVDADPDAPRPAGLRAGADALYHSSRVPHASRWRLPLPDAHATRADLSAQLERTLGLLERAGPDDDELYFFRLALLHEDMHHEAALYMARLLGVRIGDPRWRPAALPEAPPALRFEPGAWTLGSAADQGFAFDNELRAHPVSLGATEIDAQAVRWAEYLPFVETGGHSDERFWDADGRGWLAASGRTTPLHLRRTGAGWQRWLDGEWTALDLREAACHLTLHEVRAWCHWAGRRLPQEAEWERAAVTRPDAFRWGDVWEWTASPFARYPGFRPHPYRDYSAPWFDGRPVLRGASFMTQPRMRHPRYRNYFPAHRSDVPAGFRSCAP